MWSALAWPGYRRRFDWSRPGKRSRCGRRQASRVGGAAHSGIRDCRVMSITATIWFCRAIDRLKPIWKTIGASGMMETAPTARFAFADLATGERWNVTMNDGRIPWWVFGKSRIPGTRLRDYMSALKLAMAGSRRAVGEVVRGRGALWQRFWEPLSLAVLNTTPERGSARLLWRALSETFARGGAYCRPMFAPDGLGRALVDPAVAWLGARDVRPTFDHALKSVERTGDHVTALAFAQWRTRRTERRGRRHPGLAADPIEGFAARYQGT